MGGLETVTGAGVFFSNAMLHRQMIKSTIFSINCRRFFAGARQQEKAGRDNGSIHAQQDLGMACAFYCDTLTKLVAGPFTRQAAD